MQLGEDQAPAGRMITLTPLIDVVFILLFFFMLASSFIDWRAVDLRLAGGADAGQSSGAALVIVLRPHGGLTVGGKASTRDEAIEAVRSRLAGRADLAIILRPEADVSLQEVLSFMDRLKALGAQDIALSREP